MSGVPSPAFGLTAPSRDDHVNSEQQRNRPAR
jgi:hypothetical protein